MNIRYLLVPLVTLLAVGCQAAPSPSPAAPQQPAAGASMAKLTVSYSNLIADNLPEWTAKEAGIFEKHGLDVDLQNIASAQGVAAVLSGQVQIAQLSASNEKVRGYDVNSIFDTSLMQSAQERKVGGA